MPEYFKFCPKCGRVLNREWCTYCEPEKEEAYRREQMKKYQIEGDYMSDKGIGLDVHGLFGSIGSGIDHAFKKQDKEETYEYSYRDQEEFEKEEQNKNGEGVKKSKIAALAAIVAFIIGILPSLIGLIDLTPFKLSSLVPPSIQSVIDGIFDDSEDGSGIESIGTTEYYDYTEEIYIDFDEFSSNYYFDPDEVDMDSWEVDDVTYSASVIEYFLKDEDEIRTDKGIASAINDQYKTCVNNATVCHKEKTEADYFVNSYVTYRDDSYANLIITETLLSADYESDYSENHSYFFSMDTLEAVDIEEQLEDQGIKASQFADSIAETINGDDENYDTGEFAADEVEAILAEKTYYYCVNQDGEIYIAVPYEGQYYNTKLIVDGASVNIYEYLDI